MEPEPRVPACMTLGIQSWFWPVGVWDQCPWHPVSSAGSLLGRSWSKVVSSRVLVVLELVLASVDTVGSRVSWVQLLSTGGETGPSVSASSLMGRVGIHRLLCASFRSGIFISCSLLALLNISTNGLQNQVLGVHLSSARLSVWGTQCGA